jgi:thiamine-phosphate pyrophosphorylase
MKRRQTVPHQWLIINRQFQDRPWTVLRKLPPGTGVLLVGSDMPQRDREKLLRRLRQLASVRSLTIVDEEAGGAARVHDRIELRQALLQRTRLILLSPMYPTQSHPDWPTLPRMRAAAFARLARRRLMALGGMDDRRFAQVRALGFQAWAGISAFRI